MFQKQELLSQLFASPSTIASAFLSFLSLSPSTPPYLIQACQSNKIGWNAATENDDDKDDDDDDDGDSDDGDDDDNDAKKEDDSVRANPNFLP